MAKLSQSDYANDYGFQLAFLKSDPELYKLFQTAVDNAWDPQKFQAQLMQTKWYRTHGENYRQTVALQKSDPATYKARLSSLIAQIADKAGTMGATLSGAQMTHLAENSLLFGWNENQLNNSLATYVKYGSARGQANTNIAAMQQTAWRNGVKVSNATYQSWAQAIARGAMTVDDYQKYIRGMAASLAPAYADEMKQGGMDLYDIAQPYIQTMAQTLEMNPADIDLFDPTIRKALTAKGEDGKPTTTSLYDFEQTLRNDSRWTKTQGAQDAVMAIGHKVLQDFGIKN